MLSILPLSEKPDAAQTCAAWSFGEWGCYMSDGSLEKSIEAYQTRALNQNEIPRTWLGLEEDKIAGMISLVECDHSERKDLSPWLASMYVHPMFRRKGYASQLINHLHQEAKNLGFEELYLFTPDAEKLYLKNGWENFGEISDPRGFHKAETLMKIELKNV